MTRGLPGQALTNVASPFDDRVATVSVAVTTYNQERFVEEALDSVLRQETAFPVEVVIGEDCSTDRTRAIVVDYARRFPGRVRALLHERNIGPQRNLAETLRDCRGRYVALLEGDDSWTSTEKLQKQVDFLEQHPECAQCFHPVTFLYEDGSGRAPLLYRPPTELRGTSTLADLLGWNYMAFCSVMFRRSVLGSLPDCYFRLLAVDWLLFVLNAEHGSIGYLDDMMASYRVHAGGVWSGLDQAGRLQAQIDFYDAVRPRHARRFGSIIRSGTFQCCYELSIRYAEDGDVARAKAYAWRALGQRPGASRDAKATIQLLSLLLKFSAPPVHRVLCTTVRGVHALRHSRRAGA